MNTRAGTWCGAHRQVRPCTSCQSASQQQKAQWATAEGRRRHLDGMATCFTHWQPDEDEIIRQYIGHLPPCEIAARCTAIRGIARSVSAVWARAATLGLSAYRYGTTVQETARLFGVSVVTIQAWRREGWLEGRPWGQFWVFSQDELVGFIRDRPWAFDADRMRPGTLRRRAEVEQRASGWIKATEAAEALGCRPETLMRYVRRGGIVHRQRTGHNGPILMRRIDLPLIQEMLIDQRKQRQLNLIAGGPRARKAA